MVPGAVEMYSRELSFDHTADIIEPCNPLISCRSVPSALMTKKRLPSPKASLEPSCVQSAVPTYTPEANLRRLLPSTSATHNSDSARLINRMYINCLPSGDSQG